jgi:hypothetical protein
MKSTELRIGNLLHYQYFNPKPRNPSFELATVIVVRILKDIVYYKHPNRNKVHKQKVSELKPIPLTEECLLKMGFDKAINGWFCSKEYLWLRQNKLNNQWFAGVNGIGDIDCKRIDYVHCLQNLYFALTGEELTFSTPKTNSQTQAPEY